MCGRFVLATAEDLSERFSVGQIAFELQPRFNVAPTQLHPVILETAPEQWEAKLMSWGLVPRWKSRKPIPAPINARAETLAEKPMFRSLLAARRCLIPATGFYEWKSTGGRGKQPFFARPTDQELFSFAGLWDDTRPEGAPDDVAGSFTIITTTPNELMATIHDRMPVILARDEEATWLSSELQVAAAVVPLLDSYPADHMEAFPVSSSVNNARNDDPSLIEREDA